MNIHAFFELMKAFTKQYGTKHYNHFLHEEKEKIVFARTFLKKKDNNFAMSNIVMLITSTDAFLIRKNDT